MRKILFASVSVTIACLSAGCGTSYLPAAIGLPATVTPASAGSYPIRTDPLVVKLLDGAPRRWPTAGFPPLRSARFPTATPDRDLADDLRKQFGKSILDPAAALSATQSAQITLLLDASFGSPVEPAVRVPEWDAIVRAAVLRPNPGNGVLANLAAADKAFKKWDAAAWRKSWDEANLWNANLKLDPAALARGSSLYRRWCMNCHGPSGAGDGAHAIELASMPRDYRQGLFKFITAFPPTGQPKKGLGPSGKPRHEDLKRTIRTGIDGSMMPAFTTLAEIELDDLVSYVIHLSIRGETEFATMAKAMEPGEEDPDFNGVELDWLFQQNLMHVHYNWGVAAKNPIPIPPTHTQSDDDRLLSAFRGYKLYHSAEFGCIACHVKYGAEPQLKWDLWGTVVQPRNLMLGVYRGGRRGEDLYARIYGGIHPVGMTAFQNTLKTGPVYPDRPDKIWNVVHFLQALADPKDRQRLQDPRILARYKERMKEQGDFFLDDLGAVRIEQ